MANRKRTQLIHVYVSEEEGQLMKQKMELAGIKTVSMYIRGLIRYGLVYEVDYSVVREMNAQLGKIGSNVNQIAKRINETHNIYKEDLEEIKKRQSEIWRIQKYILSQQPFIKR
jgi:Bacterial mobilisation protein (MobC).